MNFAPHVKVFIVGGYVRDRLLDRECKDHDFVVVGSTPDEMLAMGFQQVGADFPVFLHPLTNDEFALARTERKVGAGYSGFETEFGTNVTLEDDLARRDLTINSMARRVVGFNELGHAKLDDTVVDPFGGQEDLRDGVLCHTTAAFAEDPLRVLRVARFRARLGFSVAPATMEMMRTLVRANEMEALTTERVFAELEKALSEDSPHLFFRTLQECGAFDRLFPGIDPRCANFKSRHKTTLTMRLLHLFFDAPPELLKRMKAPTDVQRLVAKFQTLLAFGDDELMDPQTMFGALKAVDAFRRPDDLETVASALNSFDPGLFGRATILRMALEAAQTVSFASLPSDMRDSLSGREVGEAIDQLRLLEVSKTLR